MFTNTGGSATTNPVTLTVGSLNWSGYVDTGPTGTFTSVNGDWTVPTLTCNSGTNAYASAWIGIDGYGSSTVEQDGIEADCNQNNVASYYAWYEMYGDPAVYNGDEVELKPASGYPVSPGDTITASVSVSGSSWTLSINDSAWSSPYSTSISFSGASKASAEWIVERPEVCSPSCLLTSLADFGSVTFTSATATDNGTGGSISAFSASAIEMLANNRTTVLAAPGPLGASGENFTDDWEALGP